MECYLDDWICSYGGIAGDLVQLLLTASSEQLDDGDDDGEVDLIRSILDSQMNRGVGQTETEA